MRMTNDITLVWLIVNGYKKKEISRAENLWSKDDKKSDNVLESYINETTIFIRVPWYIESLNECFIYSRKLKYVSVV